MNTVYEVKVNVKRGKPKYNSFLSMHVFDEITKIFHIPAPDHKRAMKKAKRYGRPISAHKVDIQDIIGSMEKLDIERTQPIALAIARDEMIGKKKRRNRINNREKDRKGY